MSKKIFPFTRRIVTLGFLSFFLSGCWVYSGVYTAPVYYPVCVPGWVNVPVYTFYGFYYQSVYSTCAWRMALGQSQDVEQDSRQLALGGMPLDGAREFLTILTEMDRELGWKKNPGRPFSQRGLVLSAEFLLSTEVADSDFDRAIEEFARHLDYDMERTRELVEHFRQYVFERLHPESKKQTLAL